MQTARRKSASRNSNGTIPPVLLLIGRPQDAWLATWSRAEAAVSHPIDPVALADGLAQLLRGSRELAEA